MHGFLSSVRRTKQISPAPVRHQVTIQKWKLDFRKCPSTTETIRKFKPGPAISTYQGGRILMDFIFSPLPGSIDY